MFRVAAGAGLTVTLGLVTAAALAGPAAASPAARASGAGLPVETSQCAPSTTPSQDYFAAQASPWAQRALNYTSAWQYATGAGIKVAVIDSGVDADSQFGDRVHISKTFVAPQAGQTGLGNGDCVGHGTMVAGIIGAARSGRTSFAGVAPGASIDSIKVANSDAQDISAATLGQAIGQAIADGARVINISIAAPAGPGGGDPDPTLHRVINYALQNNVVVVAAAGNDKPAQDGKPAEKGPFYPASYPGVLSVGAMDSTGELAAFSDRKSDVGVIAPGADVTSTYPGPGGTDAHMASNGTSFAAPFVSGLAALILSRDPGLTSEQVTARIEDTADGSIGAGSGHGLINPVQALTAQTPDTGTAVQAAPRPGAVKIDRSPPNLSEKVVALSLGGGALLIAIIVIAAAVVIPAGRRRGWRPGEPA